MIVNPPKYIRLVVFHKGKRVEKRLRLSKTTVAALKEKAADLKEKGIKCRIIALTTPRLFPRGDIDEARGLGKLWCPYCGDWSYFRVPKPHRGAEPPDIEAGEEISREFFLTSCWRQGIKVCAWCEISEMDWYVRKVNGTFEQGSSGKRRRRGRRKLRGTRR